METMEEARRLSLQLFGTADMIDPELGFYSFVIVITLVMSLEHIFHELHELTHDTTFKDMVLAIQKELTIVGSMAFILKIILNTSTFMPLEWIHAIEYADLLVPVTSFVYCFQGMGLIIMCSVTTDFWSKGYYMDIYSLLDTFYDTLHSAWYAKYMWVPFVSIRAQVEFRIFHDIFCEAYNINRKAFPFNEYVRISWENYLVNLVTIPLSAWVMVIALMGADFLQKETLGYRIDADCGDEPVTDDHRRLSGGDDAGDDHGDDHHDDTYYPCLRKRTAWNFMWGGVVLMFLCFIIMCLCRLYEVRLLQARGIEGVEDYPVFLELLEETTDKVESAEVVLGASHRLTETELKEAIAGIRKTKHQARQETFFGLDHKQSIFGWFMNHFRTIKSLGRGLVSGLVWCIKSLWIATKFVVHGILVCDFSGTHTIDHDEIRKLESAHQEEEAQVAGNFGLTDIEGQVSMDELEAAAKVLSKSDQELDQVAAQGILNSHSLKLKGAESEGFNGVSKGAMHVIQKAKLKLKKYKSVSAIGDRLQRLKGIVISSTQKEFKNIFLFKSPKAFFFVVEHLLMLISLYIGLWLTHVVSHADLIAEADGVGRLITIAPGILSSIMFALIVRSTILIKCITHLDTDVLDEVLEQSESSRDLGLQVKQKMIRRLSSLGQPEMHLRLLFNEIDVDGSQVLSRDEFLSFCAVMNITFSKKKWRHIFREIDRDANDEVSYEELFLFLFPDNNAALSHEKRRATHRLRMVRAKQSIYRKQSAQGGWVNNRKPSAASVLTGKGTLKPPSGSSTKIAPEASALPSALSSNGDMAFADFDGDDDL